MAQIVFKEEYDRLLDARDWQGLVNLIDRTTFSSDENTDRANELKRRFQEQADIDAKLLENATDEERDAYNFTIYGPSKTRGDRYSEEFSNWWNSMADDKGHIKIEAYNEGINAFLSTLSIPEDKLSNYNVSITSENGKKYINFDTDNDNKILLVKALINANHAVHTSAPKNSIFYDPIYSKSGLNLTTAYEKIYAGWDYALKETGKPEQIQSLYKLEQQFKQVNELYDEIMDKEEPYYQEMIVTGFMGEDDRLLQQRFARGVMDVNTYKQARADLEEQYTRLLQTGDLSQNDVYIINEDNKGSQVLEELTDNISKAELNEIINLAIADKRLHFSSAGNGIMSGTMITIDQKRDSKGNLMDDKHNKSYTFFVKDLFKSTAENDLRKNTLMDAQLQYAKHQNYGHDYKFTDGRKITNWSPSTDSAIYTDNFGNKTTLSKGEIVDLIDEDIITRGVIDYYKKIIPKNGESRGRSESYYKVFGQNDYDVNVLIDDINRNAFNIAANKYKGSNEDYIKYKATTFASVIMKALNLNLIEQ